MKTILSALAIVAAMTFAVSFAHAADAGKEVTLKGKLECAKCALHKQDDCQAVLAVKEGGKTVIYYLAENDTAKDAHKAICKKPKDGVSVTGVVSKDGDKNILTATKFE